MPPGEILCSSNGKGKLLEQVPASGCLSPGRTEGPKHDNLTNGFIFLTYDAELSLELSWETLRRKYVTF